MAERARRIMLTKPEFDAPEGSAWVYNRLSQRYEMTFDAKPCIWEAGEYRACLHDMARFCHDNSIVKIDFLDPHNPQTTIRALAHEDSPMFGVPLPVDWTPGGELMDRSVEGHDSLILSGDPDVKTKATIKSLSVRQPVTQWTPTRAPGASQGKITPPE